MKRRGFIHSISIACLSMAFGVRLLTEPEKIEEEKPNVVYMTISGLGEIHKNSWYVFYPNPTAEPFSGPLNQDVVIEFDYDNESNKPKPMNELELQLQEQLNIYLNQNK